MMRLKEIIGTNRIFTKMMTDHTLPWAQDETITGELLDFEYINNYSGNKFISPAVKNSIEDGEISAANFKQLCDVAFMMYNKKWARNWAILTMEYNPIENYSMREDETPAETTVTHTPAKIKETHKPAEMDNTTKPAETTETVTPAETTIETLPAKITQDNSVYGFNSSNAVNSDKSVTSGDSNNKGSEALTVNDSGSTVYTTQHEEEYKTRVHANEETTRETILNGTDVYTTQNERTLTRSGNIGVTTSQQMAESDIQLWRWNFFYEVFSLARPLYIKIFRKLCVGLNKFLSGLYLIAHKE